MPDKDKKAHQLSGKASIEHLHNHQSSPQLITCLCGMVMMFHCHLTEAKRTRTKVPAFLSHLQHLYDHDEAVIATRRSSVMLEPALERKLENINIETNLEEASRPPTSNFQVFENAHHGKVDSVQHDQIPQLEDLQKTSTLSKASIEGEATPHSQSHVV
ncbi:hypothetical protein K431DRAFT_168293 [Polychaeton citri CBS 116435]|uniref:Uncharacterized protein n=1 Tax=Polychaeton citri CBS 116435 TaxID=1314669 RepID=A0A9P4PZJ3_9PEZI|nr:hypothetical protein K431DRAFT_168293 [Polychaeton citri CBS 116435]